MARRAKRSLTNIKANEVSIVDTPATGETFFVVKRAVVEAENKEEIDMNEQSISKGWVDGEYKVSPEDVAIGIGRHATGMIDEARWLGLSADEFSAKVKEVVDYLLSISVEVVNAAESGESVQKSMETRELVVKSCGEKLAKCASDVLAFRKLPKDDIIGVVKTLRGLSVTETKDENGSPSPVEVEKKGEEDVKTLIESLIEIAKGLQKDVSDLKQVRKNEDEEKTSAVASSVAASVETKPEAPVADAPNTEENSGEMVQKSATDAILDELKEIRKKLDDQNARIDLVEKSRTVPTGSGVVDKKVEKIDESSFARFFGLR